MQRRAGTCREVQGGAGRCREVQRRAGTYRDVQSPQKGDLKLSDPPSGQGAGGETRTRDKRVPAADLRADSLSSLPPTPSDWHYEEEALWLLQAFSISRVLLVTADSSERPGDRCLIWLGSWLPSKRFEVRFPVRAKSDFIAPLCPPSTKWGDEEKRGGANMRSVAQWLANPP
ncbi:hypothetical protein PoB_004678400 [Plakobranchus ocellatus]|uniref:Uncharacterized protein n=1 Tax=Plakobranchus ocellatus TaxID=259542 RepID=A0AAV4BPN4_9GAST|nr:hypothetical protein PoB_004678400 [Plakobranchus ocellatus]